MLRLLRGTETKSLSLRRLMPKSISLSFDSNLRKAQLKWTNASIKGLSQHLGTLLFATVRMDKPKNNKKVTSGASCTNIQWSTVRKANKISLGSYLTPTMISSFNKSLCLRTLRKVDICPPHTLRKLWSKLAKRFKGILKRGWGSRTSSRGIEKDHPKCPHPKHTRSKSWKTLSILATWPLLWVRWKKSKDIWIENMSKFYTNLGFLLKSRKLEHAKLTR